VMQVAEVGLSQSLAAAFFVFMGCCVSTAAAAVFGSVSLFRIARALERDNVLYEASLGAPAESPVETAVTE